MTSGGVVIAGARSASPSCSSAPACRAPDARVRLIPRPHRSGQPDLNGFWQALNTAHWDLEAHDAAPDRSCSSAPRTPYLQGSASSWAVPSRTSPDALAKKKEYAANALKEDAEIKCYLPGVPRMMYMPYPVQIVQSTEFILMMSEFATAQRTIYMTTKSRRRPTRGWDGRTAAGTATRW